MQDYKKLVEALRKVADYINCYDCEMWGLGECDTERKSCVLHNAADAIEALQAQLPKRGEWVEANTRPRSAQFYCSVCHRTCYDIQPTRDKAWTKRCRYQFCPNCGADMRKMEVQE